MSELNKKMMQTPDLNAERSEKLKTLFPDLFTIEGKLNPEELKKIVNSDLVKESERFEFKWFGKSGAKRSAFTPGKATLVYDGSRSVNPEYANGNMIIEGENLETLKVLLAAYREKMKCIYIDPPYNTGNDFVYSDQWDESREDYWQHIGVTNGNGIKLESNPESNGRFHSKWMNMMYPRLLLARQLLREDGVIFISIDDNEVHHLRKICDEVFGEGNFTAQFVWNTKKGAQGMMTRNGIVPNHEYVIAYAKNINEFRFYGLKRSPDTFSNVDNDPRGPWKRQYLQRIGQGLPKRTIRDPKTGRNFSFESPYAQEKMNKWIAEDRIIFPETPSRYPARKEFLSEYASNQQLVTSLGLISTKASTESLYHLFGGIKIFTNPKPANLMTFLINASVESNDIILDFFSGSGITAHAVTKLNKEDGGNRKFILIQIPEAADPKSEAYKAGYKKISDITIERNKRVIEKIEQEKASKQPSLLEENKPFQTGFKVYQLAKSNFPRVNFTPDPNKTENENIALLDEYIKEKEATCNMMFNENELFDEVLLKNGFMLHYTKDKEDSFSKNAVFRIKDSFKQCLICMDIAIQKETLKKLEDFKDTTFICLERALNTTIKWNLKHLFGEKLISL